MDPIFLDVDEVIQIHTDQIKRYGGSSGIRDLDLLQSSMAMPQSGFGDTYLHEDLFEMAAAYLFHIVKNHPFVDGNKRVGTASALVFLKLNGIDVNVSNPTLVKFVLDVAEGKIGKTNIAEFFRKNSER
ncbi:MAG: type II toxin-antitoxin system death-on-curing family toxin [Nitrospira sp.]|nr:type II toxin-antitoxin system death-on-curing family toxin [Nitrospira sp.]